MGICSSTKLKREVDKRNEIDFENFRDNLKESDVKLFEVKAKLWEIETTKDKIKKTLISKYLFFHSDGNFLSRFKTKSSKEEILLDGAIDKDKNIKFSLKEKVNEDNNFVIKNFVGKLSLNDEKGIQFSGNVIEKNEGESDKIKTFVLDFTNVLWILHSDSLKTNVFLYNKDNYFIGISHDEKGFSIWNGIEKADNNVLLIQRYLHLGTKNNSDEGIVTYQGVYDKLEHFIGGDIINQHTEKNPQFKLQKLSKPPKQKKKL